MKNDKEKKAADADKKGLTGNIFPYEKPKIGTVKLFADEVLVSCAKNDSGCLGYPPGLS